jgi:hypothetical protein
MGWKLTNLEGIGVLDTPSHDIRHLVEILAADGDSRGNFEASAGPAAQAANQFGELVAQFHQGALAGREAKSRISPTPLDRIHVDRKLCQASPHQRVEALGFPEQGISVGHQHRNQLLAPREAHQFEGIGILQQGQLPIGQLEVAAGAEPVAQGQDLFFDGGE